MYTESMYHCQSRSHDGCLWKHAEQQHQGGNDGRANLDVEEEQECVRDCRNGCVAVAVDDGAAGDERKEVRNVHWLLAKGKGYNAAADVAAVVYSGKNVAGSRRDDVSVAVVEAEASAVAVAAGVAVVESAPASPPNSQYELSRLPMPFPTLHVPHAISLYNQ